MTIRKDIGTIPGPVEELEDIVRNQLVQKNDLSQGNFGSYLTWYTASWPWPEEKKFWIKAKKNNFFPDSTRRNLDDERPSLYWYQWLFPYTAYVAVTDSQGRYHGGYSLGYWKANRLFKFMERLWNEQQQMRISTKT